MAKRPSLYLFFILFLHIFINMNPLGMGLQGLVYHSYHPPILQQQN